MIVQNPTLEEEMPAAQEAVAETFAAGAAEQSPASVVTRIRPAQGWQLINFGELWQFRELVYFLTWRDVQGPVQADGPGRGLGHSAAALDDDRLHDLFQPAGWRFVRRTALSAVCLRGPLALDLLRDGDRRRGQQRGRDRSG